jgi:PAS domain S-box-containing protein
MSGRATVQTVSTSRVSGRPVLTTSAPIRTPDGVVVGVVAGLMETDLFARDLLAKVRIGTSGGAYFLNQDGVMLARPLWANAGHFDPGQHASDIILAANAGDGMLRYAHPEGSRLCAYRRNEACGWVVIVEADEGEVLLPARRQGMVNGVITFMTLVVVFVTLGALRRVMTRLRHSEDNYRTLTDLSPVGIVTMSASGAPVYMNERARKVFGLEPGAALPATIPLEDAQEQPYAEGQSPLDEALRGAAQVTGRLAWVRTATGERKAMLLSATQLSVREGENAGVVATLEDITERMQALEMLHQSEERFSSLFRLSPDTILLSEYESGLIVDVNESFTETFGYSRDEALGHTVQDLRLYVDDQDRMAVLDQIRRVGAVQGAEVRGRASDGREAVYSLSSQLLDIGEKRYRMTVVRDITARIEAEQALRESERFLASLLESIPVPVFSKDAEGRYLACNSAFETLYGSPKEEIVGKTVYDINPPDLAEIYHAKDMELFASQGVQRYESLIHTRGRGLRDVIFHKAVYTDDEGKPRGLVGAILDITERKAAEEALRESESRLRLIAESAQDAIIMIDSRGCVTFWNPAAERMFGYTRSEIIGRDLHEAIAPERFHTDYRSAFPQFSANGEGKLLGKSVDLFARRKDGTELSVSLSLSALNIQDSWHAVGILRDMTERMAAEEALRRSNRALTAFKEFSVSMLQARDEASFITDICRVLVEVCGYQIAWVGMADEDEEKNVRLVGNWGEGSEGLRELSITWGDEITGRGVVGSSIKTRSPQLARDIPQNPMFTPWHDFLRTWKLSSCLALPLCHEEQCLGALTIYSREDDAFDAGETELLMQLAGDLTFGILSLRQRAAHHQIEKDLADSEERFRRIVETANDAIVLIDQDTGRITDANPAFTTITGHATQDAIGKTTLELGIYADPNVRAELYERHHRTGGVYNFEFEGVRKDGATFIGSTSGHSADIGGKRYLMFILRDVTELKKMQEMMIQTEKMISVGGIAAGIAHEINNPLGIVLQAAQNLVQRTRPDFQKNVDVAVKIGLDLQKVVDYMRARKLDVFIADIQSAAARASAIIRHMLDFSRKSESRRKVCNLPEIIDKAVDLAGSDYDLKKSYDFKRIKITRDYADELPSINCTETEIEQVLLNLLRNAAQALSTANPPVPDPNIGIRLTAQGTWTRIEISDNGPGMPPEIQRRIFEPFFTTKPPGVGTGLGLSVSYFIITKGHGGRLSVESQPGAGTRFTIELPGEGG